MKAYRIVWEDAANARDVELHVDYRLDGREVSIEAIRPTQVTIYCPQTQKAKRSLPVHTETGRRVLAQAFLAARAAKSLEDEIQQAV
ncbi:MAG TPA: hypothetical protein VFB96_11280 [Pirellulaceae bacterium]|nr:hypothetical protein [Pirellulaceae bacterium]